MYKMEKTGKIKPWPAFFAFTLLFLSKSKKHLKIQTYKTHVVGGGPLCKLVKAVKNGKNQIYFYSPHLKSPLFTYS